MNSVNTRTSTVFLATLAAATLTVSVAGDVNVLERQSLITMSVLAESGPDTDHFVLSPAGESTSLSDAFTAFHEYDAFIAGDHPACNGTAQAHGDLTHSDILTFGPNGLMQVDCEAESNISAEWLTNCAGAQSQTSHYFELLFEVTDSDVDWSLSGEMWPAPDDVAVAAEVKLTTELGSPIYHFFSLLGDEGPFDASGTLTPGTYKLRVRTNSFADSFGGADPDPEAETTSHDVTFVLGNLCPADTDGDGMVAVSDLLGLLAAWGSCPAPCVFDQNGDEMVDVSDLLALLAAWGPC